MKRPSSDHRKRRTREHVIADLSINYVERFVLRAGCTVERTRHDYGIDLLMETFNQDGEPENGQVLFQVKATDQITLCDQGQAVAVRVDRRDVLTWRNEPMPIILVLYDARADLAFWIHVQGYFVGPRRILRGETVTVRIARRQVVNESAIQEFARLRDAVLSRIRGVIFDEE
jgi:hypothetical protein